MPMPWRSRYCDITLEPDCAQLRALRELAFRRISKAKIRRQFVANVALERSDNLLRQGQ